MPKFYTINQSGTSIGNDWYATLTAAQAEVTKLESLGYGELAIEEWNTADVYGQENKRTVDYDLLNMRGVEKFGLFPR